MDKQLSLADRLRESVEEDIATGRLAPGAPLDEAELCQRYGVSRTPVREALLQLSAAGMVDLRHRRSATVAQISPQRLIEMFELMAELEAMCGRQAARRVGDAEMNELEAAHRACETAREAGDADGYYHLNEAFHHRIYAASHNAFLAEQAGALHRRLRPYRRLQLRHRGRMRASFNEHQAIVDAIRDGQEEQAARLLRSHVLVQGERFADLMAELDRYAQQPPAAP